VSLDLHRQEYARRILTEVQAGNGTSQRTLAQRAGIALGLTNVILKRLVGCGWVGVVRSDRRVKYVITPEGIEENSRISTAYFAYTTRYYVEARNRVRERLADVSSSGFAAAAAGAKRVAFYGASEVGEISFVCLQEMDLVVTAVFDDDDIGSRRFFGLDVRPLRRLADPSSWSEFDVLIVMSFDDRTRRHAEAHLRSIEFPPERVFWI
jgi:hypothetical protein